MPRPLKYEFDLERVKQMRDEGKSFNEIGKAYGASGQTVRKYFASNKLDTRSLIKKLEDDKLSREKLYEMFIEKNMTYKQLAKELDCSINTVQKYLREYGITKTAYGVKAPRKVKAKRIKEDVIRETVDQSKCSVCGKDIVFTFYMTRADYKYKISHYGRMKYQCCYTHAREEREKIESKQKYRKNRYID